MTPTPKPRKTLLQKIQKIGRLLGKASYRRMVYPGLAGVALCTTVCSAFHAWTGWESALLGLPAGYGMGSAVRWGANQERGKDAWRLAVFLTVVAMLLGDVPLALWTGAGWWGVLSAIGGKVTLIFFNQEFKEWWAFLQTLMALLSVVAGATAARWMNE